MKRFGLYMFIFVTLLITGCFRETPDVDCKAAKITFVVSVEPVGSLSSAVKGEVPLNENRIDKLDIFFFSDENLVFYPENSAITITGRKVSVAIDEAELPFLIGRNLKMYIIANSNTSRSAFQGKVFSQIKQITEVVAEDFNAENFIAQSNFLMDGYKNIAVSSNVFDAGVVALRRAAVKITVAINKVAVTGYTPMEATMEMSNYLNKTTIGDGTFYAASNSDYKNAPTRSLDDLSRPVRIAPPPFYSYASDWAQKPEMESFITIMIPWMDDDTEEVLQYYYRVKFDYTNATGDVNSHKFRLNRNSVYQFTVDAYSFGGSSPESALELPSSFKVLDWSTNEVLVTVDSR